MNYEIHIYNSRNCKFSIAEETEVFFHVSDINGENFTVYKMNGFRSCFLYFFHGLSLIFSPCIYIYNDLFMYIIYVYVCIEIANILFFETCSYTRFRYYSYCNCWEGGTYNTYFLSTIGSRR